MKKDKLIGLSKEEKQKNKQFRYKVLVNIITGLRSLGTIAIFPIFNILGPQVAAGAALTFFATDFIDGKLARKLKVETFFGSLLDALSDKTFGIACLYLLSTLNPIFLIIIGLELSIFAINIHGINKGNNVKSSMAGKIKTFILGLTIVLSFMVYKNNSLSSTIISSLIAVPALIANFYVTNDYLKKVSNQEKTEEQEILIEDDINKNNEKEKTVKETVKYTKKQLLNMKKDLVLQTKNLKTRQELLQNLFDTKYYHEHKNDGLKKLLYK